MKNPKQQYFNELAPRWDMLPSPIEAAERVRQFVKRAHRRGARRILDVGCGTGVLVPHLLAECQDAECILEFDFAEGMLVENARKFTDERLARVCGNAGDLPLAFGSFDMVLCFGVLPHLRELPAVLRQLLRLLRPQGALSVGHLMGSGELNAFHRGLGEPVANDYLPPTSDLARMLGVAGFLNIVAEEKPDWYFVRGERLA